MATLGRAFVEVRADTDRFPDDVRRAMRRLNRDLRTEMDRTGSELGERLGRRLREGATTEFTRRPLRLNPRIRLRPGDLARLEARVAAATRDRRINVRINRRRLGNALLQAGRLLGLFVLNATRIFADFFDFGRQIAQIFGEAFKNLNQAMGNAASAAVTLGAAFVQVIAAAAALAAVIVLLIGAVAALLAILVALVETTQLLLTILPGLGAVALLSFGPLVLVFSNLGDAIKATRLEAEEFEEFIEDFGPNTQGALRGLRELVQFFLGIRELIQEAFFEPINDALEDLDANLGPAFRLGFENVATAAGRFAAAFIELFEHPQAPVFFLNLFRLGAVGFQEIGGAIINLIAAFANLTDATLPEIEDAIQGIADIINGWADDINQLADDPNFQDTLDDWKESFDTIRELIGEIWELAQNLIAGFRDDGIPVLEQMVGLLEQANEFLQSDAGEEFFDGLRVAATLFLIVFSGTVIIIGSIITLLGIVDEIITGNLQGGLETFNETFGFLAGNAFLLTRHIAEADSGLRGILEVGLLLISPLLTIVTLATGLRDNMDQVYGLALLILDALRIVLDPLATGIFFLTNWRGILRSILGFVETVRRIIRNLSGRLRELVGPARIVRDAFGAAATFAGRIVSAVRSAISWARTLASVLGGLRFGGGIGGLLGRAFGFGADGGIFTRPTNMIIGEAGPEVLIPLTRPSRARELYEQSGLDNLIRGGDGASLSAPTGRTAGAPRAVLEFRSGGTAFDDAMLEVLRRAVRVRGGDVQVVIGR